MDAWINGCVNTGIGSRIDAQADEHADICTTDIINGSIARC